MNGIHRQLRRSDLNDDEADGSVPELVTAAAALASFAPHDAEGLDWYDGMSAAEAYRRALTDPDAVRAGLDEGRKEELAMNASELMELFAPNLSPPDAAVLTGELAEYTLRTNQEALALGTQGWWDDSCGLIRPWGFEVTDITVPILLLHGRQDQFVPSPMASGSPPTSRRSKPSCSITMGTSHSRSTGSAKCTPGLGNACKDAGIKRPPINAAQAAARLRHAL